MNEGHTHEFGRGANGRCRTCGAESNAGKKRREAREERKTRGQSSSPKFDLHAALSAKSGFDHEGNME